jgi:hypothetical protein
MLAEIKALSGHLTEMMARHDVAEALKSCDEWKFDAFRLHQVPRINVHMYIHLCIVMCVCVCVCVMYVCVYVCMYVCIYVCMYVYIYIYIYIYIHIHTYIYIYIYIGNVGAAYANHRDAPGTAARAGGRAGARHA